MAYRRGGSLIVRKPLFLAFSKALTWLVELLGWPIMAAMYGYRARGRKILRKAKRPAILVSNHAIPLDPLLHGLTLLPRFSYFTLLEETVLTPWLGTLVRLLGGIPVPHDQSRLGDIERAVKSALDGRGLIHFYPEGECFLFNQEIREFKAGAFWYAIRFGVPVIPLITVISRRGKGFHAEVHVLEALEPPAASGRSAADLHAAIRFARSTRALMQARIDAAGGDKTLYRGPMPRIRGVNDRER